MSGLVKGAGLPGDHTAVRTGVDEGQRACPGQDACPVSPHQLSDSRRQLILVPQGASALGTPVGALPQQSPQSFLGIVCSRTHGEEFSFCSDCNIVRL